MNPIMFLNPLSALAPYQFSIPFFFQYRSVLCPWDGVVFYLRRLENPDSSLNWFYLTQYNPQYLKYRFPDTSPFLQIRVSESRDHSEERHSAPGSGSGQERRDGRCWLSLVNYHHHLFYIREPFVTKKGILTVCLMGETFKLERQYIYQRPVGLWG